MLSIIRKIVHFTSSSKGAKITVAVWLAAVIALSVFAPGANEYKVNSTEGSINGDAPSEIAADLQKASFPSDEGITALMVFHDEDHIQGEALEHITDFSRWVASDDSPDGISSALPFHEVPEQVQEQMMSEDGTTLLFNITLDDDLESKDIQVVLDALTDQWQATGTSELQFEITGPAGIAADSLRLFQNADFVLMFATIGLIFFILILIYRSPLLAIIPLLIAGIVYGVVDRVLGIFGKIDLFPIESQAVSIMLVLLFAVVTDYSLFIFSRYREELHRYESKYGAMKEAIHHVSEPIFFSGGTVTLAMLSLFVTVFEPYHSFAPVFTIAVLFILLAGLTLIPALFALLGRRAFWPAIPKVHQEKASKKRFWGWVGKTVVKRPVMIAVSITVLLAIGIVNVMPIQFSFNLLKSFPEDTTSRVGFELLEDHYPVGELAPVTILLESADEVDEAFLTDVNTLQEKIADIAQVETVKSNIDENMIAGNADLPKNFLSDDKKAVKFDIVLAANPYDHTSIETVKTLRDGADDLLGESGFSDDVQLHVAGQTADQLDVRQMNNRDMMLLFSLVIVLLTIVLGFQTRSILLPVLMMGTIVVSYVATLGFGWLIFHHLLGYDAISYRLPVYTFVFMVALGIDYNIMLVSRITEFARKHDWKDAVKRGVTWTGGVISSAGLILAATFSVLMTQPIQELFLFGFIMAMGILLDTFIIRGFFLPAILVLTHRKK